MRRRLSGLWMVISRPPCDEDFDSTSSQFEANICSRHGYCILQLLQLLQLLTSSAAIIRSKCKLSLTDRSSIVQRMRVCDSKLRLLQTAHELIWQQSYGSVGVDQICEQSGVKKGSFYHFFRSKSELTVAAYEYYWEQRSRLTLDGIFSAQTPPLERLDAYFENIRRNQTEHFETRGRVLGCPFVSLGSELSTQDEAIRLMAQHIGERKCRYLESTLRDAMDEGVIPRQEPKLLAQELHFYIVGLIQEAKICNNLAVLNRMKSGAYRIIGASRALVT